MLRGFWLGNSVYLDPKWLPLSSGWVTASVTKQALRAAQGYLSLLDNSNFSY